MDIPIQQGVILYIIYGLGISLILSPIVIYLARRSGLNDIPNSLPHKQHTKPTPMAGGSILFLTLTVILIVSGLWRDATIRVIFLGTLFVFLFGLGDDVFGLSAPYKLIGQTIAAGILIANGLSVKFIASTGGLFLPAGLIPWIDLFLTLLWLIGITNAMNLIDSMDGLAAGLNLIIIAFFLFAVLQSGQEALVVLASVVFGICLTLLAFNISPPLLFLGDSGAQTLGFLAAAIGMVYVPKDLDPLSTWFVPILVLIVPIFDTTLVVVSRFLKKRLVLSAGLDHTYHRLVRLGVPSSRAVYLINLAAFFFCGLAFIMMRLPPLLANLGFGIILLLGLVLIILAQKVNSYPEDPN